MAIINDFVTCTHVLPFSSVSPGGFTLKHAQKMEKKLKNQRLRQSLFSSKRRRLELKSQRAMKNCTQSVLEGTV